MHCLKRLHSPQFLGPIKSNTDKSNTKQNTEYTRCDTQLPLTLYSMHVGKRADRLGPTAGANLRRLFDHVFSGRSRNYDPNRLLKP